MQPYPRHLLASSCPLEQFPWSWQKRWRCSDDRQWEHRPAESLRTLGSAPTLPRQSCSVLHQNRQQAARLPFQQQKMNLLHGNFPNSTNKLCHKLWSQHGSAF